MIYLDNAATTYPKPKAVLQAVNQAFLQYGANPGRSGFSMALQTEELLYTARQTAADFFDAPGPENVVFTQNCTQAINTVLQGLLRPGDHVVVSDREHNAVMRPLHALEEQGVQVSLAQTVPFDDEATLDAFRKQLRENTKLVFCTHAGNVTGLRLPIARIGALCRFYHIPFAVDAAQSAGTLPISMQKMDISYLCVPGHKGLYGPMGTGMLLQNDAPPLSPLLYGGTGSQSLLLTQPEDWPERMESGTVNVPGIAGLLAGMRFVQSQPSLHRREITLVQRLYDHLQNSSAIRLYLPRPEEDHFAPVLSCNVVGLESEEVGTILARQNIAVRSGLHCAPSAHKLLGTLPGGTVRFCPGAFTRPEEIDTAAHILLSIARH